MNRWVLVVPLAALALAAGCGDEEDNEPGGSGGSAGSAAGDGGTSGESGGAGGEGGAEAPPPPMCDAPPPPDLGAGGASGGAGGEASTAGELAIAGTYTDDFDGAHTITSSTWTSGGAVFNIAAFDNDAQFVIAQNDEGNMYNPCAWSRFDWTEYEGDLYFCMTAYDAETEEAALETEPADASDPENGGCGEGGFAWTLLNPE